MARPTAQSASGTQQQRHRRAPAAAPGSRRRAAALPAIASERSLQRAARRFMPPPWIAAHQHGHRDQQHRDLARVVAEAIHHEEGEDRLELRHRQREDEVRDAEPPDQRHRAARSTGRASLARLAGADRRLGQREQPRGSSSRRPGRRPRTSEPRSRRARARRRSPARARSRCRSRRRASPSSGCAPARRSRR